MRKHSIVKSKPKLTAFIGILVPAVALLIAAQTVGSVSVASAAPDGKAIYEQKCGSCHHADGKGGGPFPALAGSKNVDAKDPTVVIATVKNGKGMMPAWKSQLSNAEIAAVVTYIRSAWGNKAGPVTEAEVDKVK